MRERELEKETEKRKKYDTLGEREIRSKRGKERESERERLLKD